MLITRKSPISGTDSTLDIPITLEQLSEFLEGSKLIQQIMPEITPEQREFVLNGTTAADWATLGEEEPSDADDEDTGPDEDVYPDDEDDFVDTDDEDEARMSNDISADEEFDTRS